MAKATYRSALRSKRLLRDAFTELLRENDYNRITVTEVVKRADLNRSTFYAHYASIEDLMNEMVTEVTESIFLVLKSAFSGDFLHHPEPTLELMGDVLEQEQNLYRSLSAARQADTFMASLRDIMIERIKADLGGIDSPDFPVGLASFVAGGVITLYRAWLDGAMGDVPVDEITRTAATYVKALGQENG